MTWVDTGRCLDFKTARKPRHSFLCLGSWYLQPSTCYHSLGTWGKGITNHLTVDRISSIHAGYSRIHTNEDLQSEPDSVRISTAKTDGLVSALDNSSMPSRGRSQVNQQADQAPPFRPEVFTCLDNPHTSIGVGSSSHKRVLR